MGEKIGVIGSTVNPVEDGKHNFIVNSLKFSAEVR